MDGLPAWLPGLAWALPFVGLARLAKRTPDLAHAPPDHTPVAVVIPARNEAVTIETVVTSILASEHPAFEIVVVDDRSTDDTAERVERIAARDPRVRLLRGEELPAGWFGKPWACTQGARATTAPLLLFTDADTTHTPGLLARAAGAIHRDGADLLTVTTRQECVTFWERVVMPQIMFILGVRYTPSSVNRARRVDQLVANGQFIMVRREAYERLGGHEAVKGEVVEDLALAQRFFREGRTLRMYLAETLISTRMYRSLAEMVEGWSKNLYIGAKASAGDRGWYRVIAPLLLMWAFTFWLIPPVALAVGWYPDAARVAVALSLVTWTAVCAGLRIPLRYALLYPLGALTALLIAIRSTVRGGRKIVWRGREYAAP